MNSGLNEIEEEQTLCLIFDFDGSVFSIKGPAKGTAVGFNQAKKGAPSYYLLLAILHGSTNL